MLQINVKRLRVIALASMMTIGVLPFLFTVDVNALSTNQTPVLNAYQLNNHVKLEWAVEMLNEDILYQTGFETSDELPRLTYNATGRREFGGQSFTNEDKYRGDRSLKIVNSYQNGNYQQSDLNGNITYQPFSAAIFSDRRYMRNGIDLSVSLRAKTNGNGTIQLVGVGGAADYGSPLNITFLERVNKGDRTVKVSNPGFFKTYVDQGRQFYLANAKGRYSHIHVVAVDMKKSTITTNSPFNDVFEAGEPVLRHHHRSPVSFTERAVRQADGWSLINVNTKVANFTDYNTLNRGFALWIRTTTGDTVYIDDLKMGYATQTQLFRGNEKIYDGYLSDFEDTKAVDKVKPDKVEVFTVLNENGKDYVLFDTPNDYGTTYQYKVQALTHSGETYSSETHSVEVKSEVQGFSYVIDTNPNTNPNNTVNSTTGKIEIPRNLRNNHYLHIAAVDGAGNISETTHYFLDEDGPSLLRVTPSTDGWTNENINLYVEAIGAERIVLPNGVIVNGSTASFTAKENGAYTFQSWSNDGRLLELKTYNVMNIDRTGKSVTIHPSDSSWRNKDVEVTIKGVPSNEK